MALKVTHQQLVDGGFGINHNTLRRIRSGKPGKRSTDMYFLQILLGILDKEYNRRAENGYEGTEKILNVFRQISLAQNEVPYE